LCNNFFVARPYQLNRRAERQAGTRRRIVEAAVALHTSVGPARTTVSAVAARAGVQRHTFYRHFPDERGLWLACSELYTDTHPLPDWSSWLRVKDPERRLRRGIGELYAFYEQNADTLHPVARDAAVHPLTAEMVALRMGGWMAEMRRVLLEPFQASGGRQERLQAVLGLFTDFMVWRTLRARVGSSAAAVDAAVLAMRCQ
jgi:AcrR family transcriptional regulator